MSGTDIDFLSAQNELKPVTAPIPRISDYIEGRRILPPNTPFPGFWENVRTPYMVEVMDNMSPFSPIQHTGLMAGAQIGKTAGAAENAIAYWMDESPAPVLMMSATDELLEEWAGLRLEPLIDSCGYRHKIVAQVENRKSRRSGDKSTSKTFVGGFLLMASAQSPGKQRSKSIRVLIRDEIDGAPEQLRTGEGNWLEVSAARTNAYGGRKKILDISTPTTWEKSAIFRLYEDGDQRKFLVPCPWCKKKQILDFGSGQTQHGLKAETKAGRLVRAYYICEHCREAIFNHHKTEMLKVGTWQPTAISSSDLLRTYQISTLYSPVGMLSWTAMWQEYQKALKTPEGMRSFVNLYLGLPFKESGSKPDIATVIELRGGYRQSTIPDGVLYLTAGIDVQRGSEKDEANPARLEMEVMGIGAGYRTWSICYKRFEGEIGDPYAGAWKKLHEWAKKGGLVFTRSDGVKFAVEIVFIDSGDGNFMDVVYRFTTRWQNTYPSKGFSALKRRKGETGDEAGPQNFKRYRAKKIDEDTTLLEMSTNYYKTNLYNNLKIPRQDLDPQRPGFCDFPIDYGQKYFRMLTAEEKRRDQSFHCPSGARNEALDCRVMAQCAADFYLDAKVLEFKAVAKAQGASAADLQKLTHRTVIDMMAVAVRPRFKQ
ncbi:MAG: hypothetical protein GY874_18435 [Desulfobacteraceae bacterium]|nr:hypothetical protein [Desulfobacteraceae bacterium]